MKKTSIILITAAIFFIVVFFGIYFPIVAVIGFFILAFITAFSKKSSRSKIWSFFKDIITGW